MKRFTWLALAVAFVMVFAAGAFAAYTEDNEATDLAEVVDVDNYLLSNDVDNKFLVSGDDLTNFNISTDADASMEMWHEDEGHFGKSWSWVLVRTTQKKLEEHFTYTVSNDAAGTDFIFGLEGGMEYDTAAPQQNGDFANDCTIACDYFYHWMQENRVEKGASVDFKETLKWFGTRENCAVDWKYGVECCDHLTFLAASDDTGSVSATSMDVPVVFAKLAKDSEEPFVRVRDFLESEDKGTNAFIDVPSGMTYDFGVRYTVSPDCVNCGERNCVHQELPYVMVTNLNNKSVKVEDNFAPMVNGETVVKNDSFMCNAWCGLCTSDDMMSGDEGLLTVGNNITKQSSLHNCPCTLYPGFSQTFKVAGNMDVNYTLKKDTVNNADSTWETATLRGRLNTSWGMEEVATNVGDSGFCPGCPDVTYEAMLWYPCNCLIEDYKPSLSDDVDFYVSGDVMRVMDAVTSFDPVEAGNGYSMETFDIVDSADASQNNVIVTVIDGMFSSANLADAGVQNTAFDGVADTAETWWHKDFWNKVDLQVTVGDTTVNLLQDEVLSKDAMDFLSILEGPQRELADCNVEADLFVFVYDGGNAGVEFKTAENGNRFLVIYDGAADGHYKVKANFVKQGAAPAAPALSALAASSTVVPGGTTDVTASVQNSDDYEGMTMVFEVPLGANGSVSPDHATIVSKKATTTFTAGSEDAAVTLTAFISGDKQAMSDDVTIMVAAPTATPTPEPSGGGGGCSLGFAPLALLLLAPLALVLRK
ncbi:MAG: SYNERG-CTERM sorting domain-containing protein [Synergistales bacterium]|nr:SYNERG-CTERM sorting domain-containing protein [Synergistales bacterium]